MLRPGNECIDEKEAKVAVHACDAIRASGSQVPLNNTDENIKGRASAFATLSPFKGFVARQLEAAVLFGASAFREPEPRMRARRFLHHAYWLRMPGSVFQTGTPKSRSEQHGALLFMSSFTGDLADYLGGFTVVLPDEMDLIWGRSPNWPGARNYNASLAFVRRYMRRVGAFFNAYGDAGVDDIRFALRLRGELDRLALQNFGSDEEFARAFDEMTLSLWGDRPSPNGEAP